ncbi:hypothetical protein DNU06_03425 [Putridiphycobacter roseus]|uniref:Periplasmic heavy metal sensor n=1 Tax=Putridiphycobacter roseus TaxID=2219161 RepID=A0A2W1N6V4_9FLAO|nr:hypothetical protein [Putridiphycobacter roseus]PZE18891.1 hypothetical protein DNU06_03425 [Putridiphycobacter roseus]
MKKLTIFQILTVCLLGLNLALIGFIFINRPGGDKLRGRGEMARKELRLTETQNEQFKKIADEQHQDMEDIDAKQAVFLIQYFSQLENGRNTDDKLLLNQYVEIEKKRLDVTLTHFEKLKSILDESQYEYLYNFVNRIVREVITRSAKPPRPDHH